ncbi:MULTISPECIES: tyrosine-type recombinase/integrase [Nocardia]|uniref:tyrosine-type recombinase/integrase n=1 Tax=Nocardia TaxID=1817 RepID=UPI000D69AAA4|nr:MULTISPECIES: site-specific integrase [Nocardia]
MTSTDASEVRAISLLLERLGLTAQDLLVFSAGEQSVPTFAEYVPRVYAAMPARDTRDIYNVCWRRLVAVWPDKRLDEPTPTELLTVLTQFVEGRQMRRTDRGGKGTATTAVNAMRKLYEFAINDGYLRTEKDPSRKVTKPRRPPSRRRALSAEQLTEINTIAATTGDDPELDTLILRLHTETACRRGGALALREGDLDPVNCLIRLTEKGELERWQPISPTLMRALQAHTATRKPASSLVGLRATNGQMISEKADGRLLRYKNGNPISGARYTTFFRRAGRHLPWVEQHNVTIHWLRHTTLTWVDRRFGMPVSKAYAGHSDNAGGATTLIYTRAGIPEVARALAELTGEPHPCAAKSLADLDYLRPIEDGQR